ncbi:MAG: hypothetical protein EOL87_05295 [Spartobacteria bacterium]|nr:hypothetical protein [Spartobacteria bacterium]
MGSVNKKSTVDRRLREIELEERLLRDDIRVLSKTLSKTGAVNSGEKERIVYDVEMRRLKPSAQVKSRWDQSAPHNQDGRLLTYLSTGSFEPSGGFGRVSDPVRRHRRIFIIVFLCLLLFIVGSLLFM